MLNQDKPKDYVLASNETHTVKEFVQIAFERAGIKGEWIGEQVNEKFLFRSYKNEIKYYADDIILMKINEKFYRPAEVDLLLGDSTEAQKDLGWKLETSFEHLVHKMVDNDLKLVHT